MFSNAYRDMVRFFLDVKDLPYIPKGMDIVDTVAMAPTYILGPLSVSY